MSRKKGNPLVSNASAACLNLDALIPQRARSVLFRQKNSINLQRKHKKSLSSRELHILRLIRELKHSNSNARHWRLISKGSLFLGSHCSIYITHALIGESRVWIRPSKHGNLNCFRGNHRVVFKLLLLFYDNYFMVFGLDDLIKTLAAFLDSRNFPACLDQGPVV